MTHKAVPGQPLIVKAGEYNAAMEAGQWFSQQKQLGESQSGIVGGVNPCVVKVKNDSGGNLAAGTVVELSSSLLTTLDRQHLWLSGIARAGNDPGFGVLIEPIKSGEIGLCQVSGVCLASVDIQDADNTHARLVASSTTLKGCFGGPVEILQKPSGTGVKTCVVRLGVRQSIIRRAKAAAAITAGNSGDVNVYLNGSSRGTITAYNNWDAGDVANNDEIRILYHHDLDKWEILKRGAGGTPAIEGVMFWDAITRGYGATYPRGGAYVGTEYYTFDYQKVRGDYAANHLTPLDAYSAGLPFVQVDETGSYELSMDLRFISYYNGSTDETYTTSGPSTGTAHTHTVAAWRGKEMFPLVLGQLQYQVGGSGSWTSVPRSDAYVSGIATDGYFQTGEPVARIGIKRILNLTAGWTLRQVLSFVSLGSLADHQFGDTNAEALMLRYLGPTFSDTSV